MFKALTLFCSVLRLFSQSQTVCAGLCFFVGRRLLFGAGLASAEHGCVFDYFEPNSQTLSDPLFVLIWQWSRIMALLVSWNILWEISKSKAATSKLTTYDVYFDLSLSRSVFHWTELIVSLVWNQSNNNNTTRSRSLAKVDLKESPGGRSRTSRTHSDSSSDVVCERISWWRWSLESQLRPKPNPSI